jgi:hemerythrin-like domain-containing protein
LVQARALRLAAGGSEAARRRHPAVETARGFLEFFERQLRGHMRDEERAVLPPAEAAKVEGTDRIRAEHRELEALAAALADGLEAGGELAALMQETGQLLDDHVRYEERAFFEALQRTLSPEALDLLGQALAAEREARGGPTCPVNLSADRPDPSPIRSASPSRSRRRP